MRLGNLIKKVLQKYKKTSCSSTAGQQIGYHIYGVGSGNFSFALGQEFVPILLG
jgi:hypothetical protein